MCLLRATMVLFVDDSKGVSFNPSLVCVQSFQESVCREIGMGI